MSRKNLYRQWILFILFFTTGIWGIVSAFTFADGFLTISFIIGIVQLLILLLFLKWNIIRHL
ncbi:MAG: hypothetical protein AB1796_10215 [Bacillota bacterium]